jgi:maleylpyruvate isomerase
VSAAARVPQEDLDRVDAAQRRLVAAIVDLDDEQLRRPSLLPGWTVAHVLTHVARTADSHRRRAHAAARGESVDQYPGGYEGRAAEIERGAARPAPEIRDDVAGSAEAMRAAWRDVPDEGWEVVSRDVGGRARPLHGLPARRWQELEVHVVDLDVGVTHRDWSPDFVSVWLPVLRAGAPARMPGGTTLPASGLLDDRDTLAWLYGRWSRPDLPVLAPWG